MFDPVRILHRARTPVNPAPRGRSSSPGEGRRSQAFSKREKWC